MLIGVLDMIAPVAIPFVVKQVEKDSKIKATDLLLTETEKAVLLPLCEGIAPELVLSPWEAFFFGLAAVYVPKTLNAL